MAKKKKYTLSRQYINEFFGLFGLSDKEKKQKRVDKLLDTSPELKRLDARLRAINKKAADKIKDDPELLDMMKAAGIDIKDVG